jgi:hypothetical protein
MVQQNLSSTWAELKTAAGSPLTVATTPYKTYSSWLVLGAEVGSSFMNVRKIYGKPFQVSYFLVQDLPNDAAVEFTFSEPLAKNEREMEEWMRYQPARKKGTASVLQLASGSDAKKLFTYFLGSEGFSFRLIKKLGSGTGAYFIRNKVPVGRLLGNPDEDSVRIIREALKPDVVYKGEPSAYIGDLKNFKALLAQKKVPQVFYVLHKGKYIPINLKFMQTDPSIGKFLDENVTAFFVKPIEVVEGGMDSDGQ